MSLKLVFALFIAIFVAGLVGIGGSQGGILVGSMPVFLLCGILAFAVNWAAFIPANIYKTEKYYDLTGSLTYLTLITVACIFSAPLDLRSGLIASMAAIWALRLGPFLFMRVRADGRDRRFDAIKISPSRFFLTWTLQGTWVYLTIASALVIITNETRLPFDIFAFVGVAIWIAGFVIEVTADQQKFKFRRSIENKDRFISSGIWAWSRHPNYFGEILLWTGISIASLPLLTGWQWVTIISPVFVAFLLIRISGIPKLEAHAKMKWGHDKEYVEYCASVPILIPKWPRVKTQSAT